MPRTSPPTLDLTNGLERIIVPCVAGPCEVRRFTPRLETLDAAGLLRYPVGNYGSQPEARRDFFPGGYNGPPTVRFSLCSYPQEAPPRGPGSAGRAIDLSHVRADLGRRGITPAGFHQLATFSALVAVQMTAEEWIGRYGPRRILALASVETVDWGARERIVPSMLTPGIRDALREKEGCWRLSFQYEAQPPYDGVEERTFYLAVEPA